MARFVFVVSLIISSVLMTTDSANAQFEIAGSGLSDFIIGSAATGDVDNDGNNDIVLAGNEDAQLYLNDGNGKFSLANADLPGINGGSIALGDFNNDENLDLVLVGSQSFNPFAEVYLGDGNGGFEQAETDLQGGYSSSLSLGDVNNDENLDILITNNDSTRMYLGDGDGGFNRAGADLIGVSRVTSSDLGDIDNDDNLDLVITGEDTSGTKISAIYNGDGEGNFTREDTDLPGVIEGTSSFGDVNNDGNLDLILTGKQNQSDKVGSVFLGDGEGGFSQADFELPKLSAGSTSLGDVNNDGNLDILVTGENEQNNDYKVSKLYLGDGEGGFSRAVAGLRTASKGATLMTDFNNDDNPDILLTDNGSFANIYYGDGKGGFSNDNPNFLNVHTGSNSMADVNGDGLADILITGITQNNDQRKAKMYVTAGQDSFDAKSSDIEPISMATTKFGYFDGDSTLDLVATGITQGRNGMADLLTGDGGGEFCCFDISDTEFVNVEDGGLDIGDVDNDGNLDVVVAGDEDFNDALTRVYLGDGTGDFDSTSAGLPNAITSTVILEDVNNDDYPDVYLGGSGLYMNDGDGNFNDAGVDISGVSAIEDVNGDGNADLIATHDSATTIYSGDGSGNFNEMNPDLPGLSGNVTLSKIDGDEHMDLVMSGEIHIETDSTLRTTRVYLGEGNGEFTQSDQDLTNAPGGAIALGDMDGDGDNDLVISGENRLGYPQTAYYINNTKTPSAITHAEERPESHKLSQNYPNPFNPTTQIEFSLPQTTNIKLTVYDMLGRRVATLVDGKQSAGQHTVTFDGSNLSSGMYIYRIKTDNFVESRKMLLVK